MKFLVASLLSLVVSALAFTSPSLHAPVKTTKSSVSGARSLKMENFGLGVGEDSYWAPREILGEANYKTSAAKFNSAGLLARKYDPISRVAELKLLSATADSGLLEVLESKGVTLSKVEAVLPVIEKYGLVSLAVQNQQLLLSAAPLLIEPAPALLPLVAGVLENPGVLNLVAAALVAAEVGIVVVGQNVALDVVAGIPLLGGALALTTVASLLSDIAGTLESLAEE